MFSSRVREIPQAASIAVNQLVYEKRRKGEDIIVLSLGEAFFDIPRFEMSLEDFERGYHYSDSQGLPELREKIASFHEQAYGVRGLDPSRNLLVTAGSKLAFFLGFLGLVNSGDEVFLHEPCWLSYESQIVLAGGQPKFLRFDLQPAEFPDHFTDRTRVMVLNNPNNPAGRLYSEQEIRALADACRDRGIYLLVDEAYSDFVIDGSFFSASNLVPTHDNVVVINSLSKNLGMSGWRIGYFIAAPSFIEQALKLNQHVITCAPTALQLYVTRFFEDILERTLPQARNITEHRNRVADWAVQELGLELLPGSATFYMFVGLEDCPLSSHDFALKLLAEHNVAVVPGSAYGRSTERFVRVSVGTESTERIQHGLRMLKSLLDN